MASRRGASSAWPTHARRALTDAIGDGWLRDLDRLSGLEAFADDAAFQDLWRSVKQANKRELGRLAAHHLRSAMRFRSAMLDAQCKRIHEYKRQHLNLLHAIALLERNRTGEDLVVARTSSCPARPPAVLPRGQLIIRRPCVADASPPIRAPAIACASCFVPELQRQDRHSESTPPPPVEQISDGGNGSSGTGNMKFTLNGALTIARSTAPTVEIRDAVGPDHFFLFGLTAEQVIARRAGYRPVGRAGRQRAGPRDRADRERRVLARRAHAVRAAVDDLLHRDPFSCLADFRAYADCQAWSRRAGRSGELGALVDPQHRARGRFSSDRAVREYARTIWNVAPVPSRTVR